ncbi:hypothetical protein WISP_40994 [Willisornis vidua]|uniref:Uncharacterized protein n=1 Tax=Willisornis vidua TaxID=1566151 RepID=A0ABQ9DMN3_9PASS|nr:hypothetical protein WISP_40994 [Willisornis vidua]
MVTEPFSIIYQQSWLTVEVPSDWKLVNVTLIYKKGWKEDPVNYRLVSLTSVLGKGSELRSELFNIFINNLHEKTECTLNQFVGDTKLDENADLLEDRKLLPRDLDRLDQWSKVKCMKFKRVRGDGPLIVYWHPALASGSSSTIVLLCVQSPLEQLERSRKVSEYKLQPTITIQYLNLSPVFLSSMDLPMCPEETDPLDKFRKGFGWFGNLGY